MKIAIVHEWLTSYAGSEQVVEQILALFPEADLYSLVDFLPENERHGIRKRARTSFLQHLPFARTKYRNFLPLMPLAVERFDLSAYDLILSSSHAVAKGVKKRPGQLHICYCHTPMRYAWDLRDQYLAETGLDRGLKGAAVRMLLERMRKWDARTSAGVDHFIANSRYIAERIRRCYNRDSTVIYPPVDIEGFSFSDGKEDYYVAASRMVPYKKMDLIVEAFGRMPERRLVVIGDGPDLQKVRDRAGRNVELLGYQTADALKGYLQRARAFVFAAEEDFGIVPVEAQACGTPVIAFGRGGVLETVVPLGSEQEAANAEQPATGLFFPHQTVDALVKAVDAFEANRDRFDHAAIRRRAERFSRERFRREYEEFVRNKVEERRNVQSSRGGE